MDDSARTPELTPRVPPALAKVIEIGARMNQVVPEGVALGGAVCALYAQHRLSLDVDFVLENLRGQFDEVRDRLLDQPGWQEARVRPPHLILGSLDEVEVGFRQLCRKTPIETQLVPTEQGPLTIPTLEEMPMRHRHLTTQQWTLMAIESLLERGRLSDWREFAQALSQSERLAADTLRVCEYVEDRRSAALARVLVLSCHPELAGRH